MDLNLTNFALSDFLMDSHWNGHMFKLVFGEHINLFIFYFGFINLNALPQLISFPKAPSNRISNMVYKNLVSYSSGRDPW